MKGVVKTENEVLVTEDEIFAKLHEILGGRFTNHGQLFQPTFPPYEALQDDTGLNELAKEFCRWLGYKPRRLTVKYGSVPGGSYSVIDAETVTINALFRDHPLVTGGILALAMLEFVLERHDYIPDERFIDVSSVEAGLGLWVINALQPKRTLREKLYHMIDGNWLQLEGLRLDAMTTADYLRLFSIYASINRLFPEDYGRSISRRSMHFLPTTPSATKIIPLPEPNATHRHIQQANKLWIKILLLSMTVAAILLFSVILISQRSKPVSYEETRDAQALRTVKSSLDDCLKLASKQQSTYDPNDLFMTRQIDATKTRCESLRNQYNDALSLYEVNYPH